jgi:hypothetical protein
MSGGAARLDDVAVGALQDVLGAEHAALWSYALAVAFIAPDQVAAARTDAAAHRELRAQIEITLTQLGQRPVSAQPAYATAAARHGCGVGGRAAGDCRDRRRRRVALRPGTQHGPRPAPSRPQGPDRNRGTLHPLARGRRYPPAVPVFPGRP